jgi:hypothetical protein
MDDGWSKNIFFIFRIGNAVKNFHMVHVTGKKPAVTLRAGIAFTAG